MYFWYRLLSLRDGEEAREKVIENVKANINFRGSRLWILACAILIASVGLNVNSTAVIIGAMLISPLMGPILGAGLGIGIYDFALLKRSLFNLFVATFVGLLVSFLYFYVSPFKMVQSELLSRTAPNIYDVFIAFFGGLAGVIAMTRIEKGTPIAGVAIATALMPPLCTAGFGLAVGNLTFFAGAMFLYTINCVFICIATYIIIKYLKYPAAKHVNAKEDRRVKMVMWLLTLLLVIPSGYFAYQFYKEQKFKDNVSKFISKEMEGRGKTVIFQRSTFETTPRKIEVALLNNVITEKEMEEIEDNLAAYNLNNTKLLIKQDTSLLQYRYRLDNEQTQQSQNIAVAGLQQKLSNTHLGSQALFKEAKALFPGINNLSFTRNEFFSSSDSSRALPVMIIETENAFDPQEMRQLHIWISTKFGLDTLLIKEI